MKSVLFDGPTQADVIDGLRDLGKYIECLRDHARATMDVLAKEDEITDDDRIDIAQSAEFSFHCSKHILAAIRKTIDRLKFSN
jgi:hypothetical protein